MNLFCANQNSITESKYYFIDGCFDGYHYGHANAIFQSKQKCDNLILGTHDDIEMKEHKNVPLFDYDERSFMLQYCKYVNKYIGTVPYIVNLQTIYKYNCTKYLHGNEQIITRNNVNGIQIPLESYITYEVTKGISTTNLLLRLY